MTRKANRAGFQIRKYGTYRRMPWRNGRGVTLEIAREPAAGDRFAWRLSLADIDRSGEFSAYPGYRRALVLIAGKGLRLRFRGHGACFLDPARRAARFEGDWKTHCAIPAGPCTDLSLIVRKDPAARPATVVRAPRMVRMKSTGRVALARGLYGALFIIEGSVAVAESTRARSRTARDRDTVLFLPGPERTVRLRSLGTSAPQLALLRWRPGKPGAKR